MACDMQLRAKIERIDVSSFEGDKSWGDTSSVMSACYSVQQSVFTSPELFLF